MVQEVISLPLVYRSYIWYSPEQAHASYGFHQRLVEALDGRDAPRAELVMREHVAAARSVQLTEVESTLEGDMDVQGALGLSDEYRNGFERIRVSFRIAGDAPEEKLREVVARAQKRSAVFDMVSNGVPVTVDVATD